MRHQPHETTTQKTTDPSKNDRTRMQTDGTDTHRFTPSPHAHLSTLIYIQLEIKEPEYNLGVGAGNHGVQTGGVQKEAYFFKVPCITLREETEWIKTVESGWNVLVGAEKSKIIVALQRPVPTSIQQNMFVDESASKRILRVFDNIMRDEHGEQ